MAKGQDEDSLWFKANPRKKQLHRYGRDGEQIAGTSVAGLPICVTNLGGLNRAYHLCDERLKAKTEAARVNMPTCSSMQCQARHGGCRV